MSLLARSSMLAEDEDDIADAAGFTKLVDSNFSDDEDE